MKKVVLLACIMVVSGFACDDILLQFKIQEYNKCINRSVSSRYCEKEAREVERLQNEYNRYIQKERNDEIRKLNRKLDDIDRKLKGW